MSKVVYSPYSFASIMRAIFELLYDEIEDQAGADARRKLHQQHVKLRQKIQAAYDSQIVEVEYGSQLAQTPVAITAIALAVLHRIEGGAEIADILKISKGKLLKLARKGLEK
jgi:hypothetical protein